jgi:hypothetical protein
VRRCEECEVEAEGDAQGWEAHLADLDDDGQDEIVFYCPICAEREFHTTTQWDGATTLDDERGPRSPRPARSRLGSRNAG